MTGGFSTYLAIQYGGILNRSIPSNHLSLLNLLARNIIDHTSPLRLNYYSPFHYYQNTDWGNYAQKFGKIATVTALGMAVVEFLLLHWISATYSICLGLALAVIELPGVYNFIGACNNLMYDNCIYSNQD